jgi:sulfite exporter TauE/SafE
LSDLLSSIESTSLVMLPWATFIAGLMGSLHCIGMCGGLAMACSGQEKGTKSGLWSYQFGRLASYSILGGVAGFIGQSFNIGHAPKWFTLVPASLIGLIFIYMGISVYRGKKPEIKLPSFIQNLQSKLFRKFLSAKSPLTKSFGVGAVSILLPCGFLYGVVIATAAFQSPLMGAVGMATFWLGTVPAMGLAPALVQKILRPLSNNSPKLVSLTFVIIGLATISMRVYNVYGQATGHSCH